MRSFDFGVVFALKEEAVRFLDVIGESEELDRKQLRTARCLFQEVSLGTAYDGFIAILPDEMMGPSDAGMITASLLEDLGAKPPLIVNIGIAGAMDDDLNIGDVVIAKEVKEYESKGKMKHGDIRPGPDGSIRPGPDTVNLDNYATKRAIDYKDKGGVFDEWQGDAVAKQEDFDIDGTKLDSYQRKYKPEIKVGNIATGPWVNESQKLTDFIQTTDRNLIAAEMEAAVIAQATPMETDTLVIRAISDLGPLQSDSEDTESSSVPTKDEIEDDPADWRGYAGYNASLWFKYILQEGLHETFSPTNSNYIKRQEPPAVHHTRDIFNWAQGAIKAVDLNDQKLTEQNLQLIEKVRELMKSDNVIVTASKPSQNLNPNPIEQVNEYLQQEISGHLQRVYDSVDDWSEARQVADFGLDLYHKARQLRRLYIGSEHFESDSGGFSVDIIPREITDLGGAKRIYDLYDRDYTIDADLSVFVTRHQGIPTRQLFYVHAQSLKDNLMINGQRRATAFSTLGKDETSLFTFKLEAGQKPDSISIGGPNWTVEDEIKLSVFPYHHKVNLPNKEIGKISKLKQEVGEPLEQRVRLIGNSVSDGE